MRRYKLKIELPFLPKGAEYAFDDETGYVYRIDERTDERCEYPLRKGLAGYLWLLCTEGAKYFSEVTNGH